jgi:hypothetical protein
MPLPPPVAAAAGFCCRCRCTKSRGDGYNSLVVPVFAPPLPTQTPLFPERPCPNPPTAPSPIQKKYDKKKSRSDVSPAPSAVRILLAIRDPRIVVRILRGPHRLRLPCHSVFWPSAALSLQHKSTVALACAKRALALHMQSGYAQLAPDQWRARRGLEKEDGWGAWVVSIVSCGMEVESPASG